MPVSLTIRRILSVYPIDLPLFHPIALKLQQVLCSSDFSIEEVIRLAEQDQALAAKILRIANSPAYRGSAPVETIKESVVRLGAQSVANIAMAASQSALHSSDNETVNRHMRRLWQHSHACALGCRWTAQNVGLRLMADQAYLAGLLHDIGKLYLLKVVEKLTRSGVACATLEEQTLLEVCTELHVEEGLKLMEHWDIPPLYCTIVGKHHDPQCMVENLLLLILRIVNAVCRKTGASLNPEPCPELSQMREAGLLGFGPSHLAGLEQVLEEARSIIIV